MRKHGVRFPEVNRFSCLCDDHLWWLCLFKNFKSKAHALSVVMQHHSPLKNWKNIYSALYSHSLKFYSTPQINWLCRWRRRALLSAKCGIERLSGAASHQSSTNYIWCPHSIESSEACLEGGWKAEWRILGSYQFKLWFKNVRGASVHPTGTASSTWENVGIISSLANNFNLTAYSMV